MKKKKLFRDIAEAFLIGVLIFLLTIFNLISPLDYMIKDAVYQMPRGIDSKIKIIGIDDKTIDELGQIQTWSRETYAQLLTQLNVDAEYSPVVIAFDILFSGEVDEAGDAAFTEACKEAGNVVVASQFTYKEKGEMTERGIVEYPIESYLVPFDSLISVTEQGFTNVSQDSDGVVRRVKIKEQKDDVSVVMFSQKIYEMYCKENKLPISDVVTDKYGKTLINYSGKPGDYECLSFVDVLNGEIDPRAFQGSVVLIGAYATGMQDNFKVPCSGEDQMYGVEIHANILQSMFQNRFSVNANPYLTGLLTALAGVLLHLILKKRKIWLSTILLFVSVVVYIGIGILLNEKHYAIHLLYLPLGLVISYVYCLISGYIFEKLKQRKILTALKKYVAPEIVEEIAKKGDFKIQLGGENRDIAVLFVDIRGFTTMSEVLTPEEVVAILNRYLNLTTNAIFKNKGTLDKFVGDATMAVFNSPFDLDDYEFRAVCAAMDIVEGGAALEKELLEKFGRTVGFGVGVNCGEAVVGNVGCEFRMDYTAIGDTVNTAARLESSAKKGQVLISDAVYERVKDRVEVEEIGEIPLKGKSKGVFVYSVTAVKRENV
ncbi:MAG: adenylate/guanylate cyclase domain-containing protein [Lachnospiraceae bacterium]|nr:adenylate/guanylate cyclase domain-containing protein [Lachnospiraceae bacterium]